LVWGGWQIGGQRSTLKKHVGNVKLQGRTIEKRSIGEKSDNIKTGKEPADCSEKTEHLTGDGDIS